MVRSARCAAPSGCPESSVSGCRASRVTSNGWNAARAACQCRSRCATASIPPRAISASRRWREAVMPDRKPVGLIGIGLLGQALAHRLLGAGFEVNGFDVDAAKNARLAELGGRAAAVADVAKRCDP